MTFERLLMLTTLNPLTDSTPNKAFIIIGAVMLVLVVAVIAAVFIKYRRRAKVTEG